MSIKGKVRKFGDNIDTDGITPAAWLHLEINELVKHAFEPIVKDFYKTVKDGDVIVAGNNFGCGSSREQATEVVKVLGIKYVICESMARIYFRNCIGLGLYPIICPGVGGIFREGDEIIIDIEKGEVKNPATGKSLTFKPLTGTAESIRAAGGILPHLKKRI
ncbi:MAG TPA: 3-isopropylmalate dehydratase [Dehalococcoidales bacterium]|nr:3-isopropylmalate dehydratase [Dehalococcoidales bacterium]